MRYMHFDSKAKMRRTNKIGVNVPGDKNDRCADFKVKRSKVKVTKS